MKCPRCLNEDNEICKQGIENGRTVWTMYYCPVCEFNWRDSEPAATLNPELRPRAFQLDPNRLEDFEVAIPLPKR